MEKIENISVRKLLQTIQAQFTEYMQQQQDKIPIIFKPVTPSESIQDIGKLVVITYRLLRREPASMQGKPFTGDKFYTPRPTATVATDPAVIANDVLMHIHENIVEFTFVSDSYSKASEQSDYFEDFMQLNRNVLRKNGYPEIIFWERPQDSSEEINGKVVYYIFQRYYVRTKRLVVSTEDVIRRIELKLNELKTGG